MTTYNVHIYREMRLTYGGIDAGTPEEAARIARARATDDADSLDDCDGETFAALVDVAGDEDFKHSVTIPFEGKRLLEPTRELLEALEHVRATLKLRHIEEASDAEVEEALTLADRAIAQAQPASPPPTPRTTNPRKESL